MAIHCSHRHLTRHDHFLVKHKRPLGRSILQTQKIPSQTTFPNKTISWRGITAILFTLSVLSYSYSVVTETNVPASQMEIDRVIAAAKADKRAQVAAKLQEALNSTPQPKVWQLHKIKYQLGLTYVDSEDYKADAELKLIEKNLKH